MNSKYNKTTSYVDDISDVHWCLCPWHQLFLWWWIPLGVTLCMFRYLQWNYFTFSRAFKRCQIDSHVTSLMNEILQLMIWYLRIEHLLHFMQFFAIDFNRWRWFKDSSLNGGCMVKLQQWNMKYKMDFHGVWKLELEHHNIYLFYDGEWTKYLIIQFFQRSYYFNIMSSKPNLVSNLEVWLLFTMFINIFLVSSLQFFKVKHKSNAQLFTNHKVQFLVVGFTILFTPWKLNLGHNP
jgi:hypothetical protein